MPSQDAPLRNAGFIAWNHFQIAHYSLVLKKCIDPTIIIPRERLTDADNLMCRFRELYSGHALVLPEADIPKLDGYLDIVFSQTGLNPPRVFRETRMFRIQYSMTKERHQYGPWNLFFDAAFVYGPYSEEILSYYCPSYPVGHIRLGISGNTPDTDSLYHTGNYDLDPHKPTILYAPTWGQLSSFDVFINAVPELRRRYNILVRPHHNTFLREFERTGLITWHADNDIVDSSKTQLLHADYVVSDYSGIIFDALYLRKPVILLRPDPVGAIGKENLTQDSIEIVRESNIGPVVRCADDLVQLMDGNIASAISAYRLKNENLRRLCFAEVSDPAEMIRTIVLTTDKREFNRRRSKQQVWLQQVLLDKRRRSSRTHSASSRWLKRTRSALSSAVARVMTRHRTLYMPYLFLRNGIRGTAQAGRLVGNMDVIGSGNRMATLSLPFALMLSGQIPDRFIRSYVRRRGMIHDRARAHFLRRCLPLSRLDTAAAIRIAHLTNDCSMLAQLYRSACEKASSHDDDTVAEGFSDLMSLRHYNRCRQILSERPKLYAVKSITDQVVRLRHVEQVGSKVMPLLEAAASNETSGFNADPITFGKGLCKMHLFFPPHFYATWDIKKGGQRAGNWGAIRQWYANMVDSLLIDSRFCLVPRHQYTMCDFPESIKEAYFTFFTKGGAKGNWHLKDAVIPGYFSIDPYGFWGSSVLSKCSTGDLWKLVDGISDSADAQHLVSRILYESGGNKYSGTSNGDSAVESEDFLFVALQSTRSLENIFVPVETFVRTISRIANKRRLRVVFKRHPLCEDPLISSALKDAARRHKVSVSVADTYELVQRSKVVLTLNSGVALQAVVAEKPVITLGPSDVDVVGIKGTLRSLEGYLDKALSLQPDLSRYRKFLNFYIHNYLISSSDISGLKNRFRLAVELSEAYDDQSDIATTYVERMAGVWSCERLSNL